MTTKKITISRHGGTQTIYRFDNGYGASIIRNEYSYGDELAVTTYKNTNSDINDFELCYNTPITRDVLGHLTPSDIEVLLIKIAALPRVTM